MAVCCLIAIVSGNYHLSVNERLDLSHIILGRR